MEDVQPSHDRGVEKTNADVEVDARRCTEWVDSQIHHINPVHLPQPFNVEYTHIEVTITTIPSSDGQVWYSPYKFLINAMVYSSDENPIYIPIDNLKDGVMKLELILVTFVHKELNDIQLRPFPMLPDERFYAPHKRLNPKQLIKSFELQKCRLVLRLWRKIGDNMVPDLDTGIISNIIEAVPPKKKSKPNESLLAHTENPVQSIVTSLTTCNSGVMSSGEHYIYSSGMQKQNAHYMIDQLSSQQLPELLKFLRKLMLDVPSSHITNESVPPVHSSIKSLSNKRSLNDEQERCHPKSKRSC
ncbi:unnamed protein product, partial [Didymodactylos carnosus]